MFFEAEIFLGGKNFFLLIGLSKRFTANFLGEANKKKINLNCGMGINLFFILVGLAALGHPALFYHRSAH